MTESAPFTHDTGAKFNPVCDDIQHQQSPLRILLIGNYPADQQKSMDAFTRLLATQLVKLSCHVEVLTPKQLLVPRKQSPTGLWKWVAYLDKFLFFPFYLKLKAKKFDIVHVCDHSNAMYLRYIKRQPNIITCHDVIAIQAAQGQIPDWQVSITGKIFQKLISNGLTRFNRIICVSKLTELDLHKVIRPQGEVAVIYNGLNADFRPNHAAYDNFVSGLSDFSGYYLHVGSGLPRKNRLGVIRIFNELLKKTDKPTSKNQLPALVFIGPGPDDAMSTEIDKNGLRDKVFFKHNVTHDELCSAYSGAIALLFPSLNEGFGWPIIEAQACACPVVTSDLAPMNEIGGTAAIYISPKDEITAAQIIRSELPTFKNRKCKGLNHAKAYTGEAMAKSYLEQYKQCIKDYYA